MKRHLVWMMPLLLAALLSGCASVAWRSGSSSGYFTGFSQNSGQDSPQVYGQINSSYTHRIK